MGWWNHTAFVASPDVAAVERALAAVFARDGMYVSDASLDDATRAALREETSAGAVWAVAVFPGARGWCVLKTAPLEVLAEPSADSGPRIAALCRELGCDGFAYNAYDGDSHVLIEASAAGSCEVSGYCGPSPGRFHGGPDALDPDGMTLRFGLVDPRPAVAQAAEAGEVRGVLAGALPTAPAIARVLAARRAAIVRWVSQVGGSVEERPVCGRSYTLWRAPAAALVAALTEPSPPQVGVDATGQAILRVFGGPSEPVCDNGTAIVGLIEGAPISVPGLVARYFRRA